MTAKEQIAILANCGCEYAIKEIEAKNGVPLPVDRLEEHLAHAVEQGFAFQAEALTKLIGKPLTDSELHSIIVFCLEREWIPDAIYASKLGSLDEVTRNKLVKAMVTNNIATTSHEAIKILEEQQR